MIHVLQNIVLYILSIPWIINIGFTLATSKELGLWRYIVTGIVLLLKKKKHF